jgi:hypothetical protein
VRFEWDGKKLFSYLIAHYILSLLLMFSILIAVFSHSKTKVNEINKLQHSSIKIVFLLKQHPIKTQFYVNSNCNDFWNLSGNNAEHCYFLNLFCFAQTNSHFIKKFNNFCWFPNNSTIFISQLLVINAHQICNVVIL